MMDWNKIGRIAAATVSVLFGALGVGASAILIVTGNIHVALFGLVFAAPAAIVGAALFALIYGFPRTCSPLLGAPVGALIGMLWVSICLEMSATPISAAIGAVAGVAGAIFGQRVLKLFGLPIRPLSDLWRASAA